MKAVLMVLIAFLLFGCATTTKVGVDSNTRKQLEAARENFFHMTEGEEELERFGYKADAFPAKTTRTHSHFQCSEDHNLTANLSSKMVTAEFEESDLRDVLFELSLQVGFPILMDDYVEGIVSASFDDQNIRGVLDTLLSIGEFDYKVFQSYIFVGSSGIDSASFHQLSNTCIYRPSYLDALSLATLLPDFYQRYIKLNKQNGYIAITASDSMMHRIQHDIALFDVPQKQVVMELSIVEVSVEALEILGLDWHSVQNKSAAVYDRELSQSAFSGRTVSLPALKARHFLDAVNILKKSGNAEMKTMPSIVVLEGKEAKFKSMKTTWTPELMSSSSKKEPIHYGVDLSVTPFVSENRQIKLDIKNATVSDFVRDISGLPRLVEHSISSYVSVADGESLIIGGLLQKKHHTEKSGIPVLSDMPVVNSLFGTTKELIEETEVLIILKPKVIRG